MTFLVSLLISISKKINHPYIEISYKKGSEYLLKFYKKNNHDYLQMLLIKKTFNLNYNFKNQINYERKLYLDTFIFSF